MRAKFVNENLRFERNRDPKRSLNVGQVVANRDPNRRLHNFQMAFPEINHAYNSSSSLMAPGSHPKWQIINASLNDSKDGIPIDERSKKYLDWFKQYTDFDIVEMEHSSERSYHEWGNPEKPEHTDQMISIRMRNKEDMTSESLDFERGEDPKKTMRIGKAGLNPFLNGTFNSMKFWKYLQNSAPAGSIRWEFLKKAADLLDVKEDQVLVAIDSKGNNLNQYDLEDMELDDWTTEEEIEINDEWYLVRDTNDIVYVIKSEEGERFVLGKDI